MINELAKLIINLGVILIAIGALLWLFGKLPFIGKLPGDIYIKKGNFSFYAPIVTTLLISLILSIILTIISNLKK
jgi:hypothetical protein